MATVNAPSGQTLLLYDIDWKKYKQLLRLLGDQPGMRLTYDRGTLEITKPSFEHENESYLLGRFVDTLVDELGLSVKAGRCTTLRRRRRGLEPDNCYWIANALAVQGRRRINLATDPPPDLALEVDVEHSSLDRMRIYAALGVPEVWRLDNTGLSFLALQPNRSYAAITNSLSFSLITAADLQQFLTLLATEEDATIVRQFRDWLRQQIATHGGSGSTGATEDQPGA